MEVGVPLLQRAAPFADRVAGVVPARVLERASRIIREWERLDLADQRCPLGPAPGGEVDAP